MTVVDDLFRQLRRRWAEAQQSCDHDFERVELDGVPHGFCAECKLAVPWWAVPG